MYVSYPALLAIQISRRAGQGFPADFSFSDSPDENLRCDPVDPRQNTAGDVSAESSLAGCGAGGDLPHREILMKLFFIHRHFNFKNVPGFLSFPASPRSHPALRISATVLSNCTACPAEGCRNQSTGTKLAPVPPIFPSCSPAGSSRPHPGLRAEDHGVAGDSSAAPRRWSCGAGVGWPGKRDSWEGTVMEEMRGSHPGACGAVAQCLAHRCGAAGSAWTRDPA